PSRSCARSSSSSSTRKRTRTAVERTRGGGVANPLRKRAIERSIRRSEIRALDAFLRLAALAIARVARVRGRSAPRPLRLAVDPCAQDLETAIAGLESLASLVGAFVLILDIERLEEDAASIRVLGIDERLELAIVREEPRGRDASGRLRRLDEERRHASRDAVAREAAPLVPRIELPELEPGAVAEANDRAHELIVGHARLACRTFAAFALLVERH